ncbi:sugar transferase [Terrabacter sp. Ter38]|uniref:sugar transferase n=1 Tax=Terrabacter sp. Ter38 TaxID=2926030 RepID=UPI002117D383|nr:sugar transferase [Terrabacter sp. Ter38]
MIIAVVVAVAGVGHFASPVFPRTNDVDEAAMSVGPWVVMAWMLANILRGSYAQSHLGVGSSEYARVLSAAGITAGLIGITSYLTKADLSRAFFVQLFLIGVPLLLLWRWSARRIIYRLHDRGLLLTRVLLSGAASHVDDVARVLDRERWLGYRVIGALLPDLAPGTLTPGGVAVIGSTENTASEALASDADLVLLTGGAFSSPQEFRHIAWDLEGHDVQMAVAPSLNDISSERMAMRPVGGLPLVHVEQPQSLAASRSFKRIFDMVGASTALALASPVMLVFAILTKIHDGGPVLFRQIRVGRDGELFECLKFRSMVVDAEARLSGVSHLNKNPEGVLFKAKDDPRITRVGSIMRRFSIDELPQLFNVINGDMSLVGPRPALPSEVRRYEPDVQRRLHVRPGLTGLWQVSGRSDLSWDDTVRLDLYYVDNWSPVQDLSILVRTVRAVFASRGAY